LMILIIHVLGEEYKLRSSTLCSFLQLPITLSLYESKLNSLYNFWREPSGN
jgi:hypothetical protein